jgi:signal transduction histidine kinase
MSKKFYAYRTSQLHINRLFPLVAIGASTGGMEAVTELFGNLPADTGMCYLYVQHFDQTKKTDIISALEQVTAMPILHALDGMPVLPDHIYIIPPGKDTIVNQDRFTITMLPEKPLHRMPVDRLFTTLAQVYGDQLTGIVLSGVTRDGTVGLQAIKAAGGSTFVQDESALFNYMPRSAIVAGVADHVLSSSQIAATLVQISLQGQPFPIPATSRAAIAAVRSLQKKRSSATVNKGPSPAEKKESPAAGATLHAQNRALQQRNKQLTEAYEKTKQAADEHKQLLQEKNADLKQLNKALEIIQNDLQHFTYVTSHDLQEPIRKIITFSDRLQQRYNTLLPDTGRNYIEKIISAALRMTHLLDDLLTYIRIANEKDLFSFTNLTDIIDRVLDGLQESIQQRQADISYWGLPVIEAIPHQIEMLFYHLISNAMKFTHPHQSPVITITSGKLNPDKLQQFDKLDRSLSYYEIFVRDNGIGFNQEFANQIFVIFQRLNDKREFPGTGIGLALCRKITTNHNGEIYAESGEGEGSAFHVILPVRQP